jgi:ribosomal RNA-processing protein 1
MVQLGLKYFKTFLLTMRREWGNIDHHRLDKYLSLVRKFMRELCTFLARADW